MARHRMSIGEWELYIPDVGDERQLFADNPSEAITMELSFLSKRQREHFQRVAEKAGKGPEQRKRADSELRRMFEEHVRGIANVTIEDGTPVITGVALYDSDEEDIKMDVAEALMSIGSLEEGLAKKLRQSSACSSEKRTTPTTGDAPSATPASSPDSPETPTPTTPSSGSTTTPSEPIETATVTEVHSTMRPRSTGGAPGPS